MSAPLSQYVRDCLAEDKYGLTYVQGLDGRIGTLNYAQLIDITQVLAENAENAKSATWKKANVHILQSVYKHFVPKHQQEVVNTTTAARRGRKKGLALNKRRAKAQFERRAVMEQVRERILNQARAQVQEAERKRQVEEKERETEYLRIAEQRQWKLYIACSVYFALFMMILTLTTTSATFIASGVVAAFFSTCIGVWLTHRMGRFRRVAVSDEDLERASLEISDRVYREALARFKRNEQEFKGKMREEMQDRRRARQAVSVVLNDEMEAAEAAAIAMEEGVAAERDADLGNSTAPDEAAGADDSGEDDNDASLSSPLESDVDGGRVGAAAAMPDFKQPVLARAVAPALETDPATEDV
jgi:hypothetical protein